MHADTCRFDSRGYVKSNKYALVELPAITRAVATKESMALAYFGSLSVRNLEQRRHSIVATPSMTAP